MLKEDKFVGFKGKWLTLFILVSLWMAPVWPACLVPNSQKFYRYSDNVHGFSLELPRNWSIIDNPTAALLTAAPKDGGRFRPNLNIIIEEIHGDFTLEELVQTNVRHAQGVLRQFRILEMSDLELSGKEAMSMLYTCRVSSNGQYYDVKSRVYCILNHSHFYIITCCTLIDQYDQYESLFKLMVDSLRLY